MKKVIEITKVGFSVNIERDFRENKIINSYIPTEKNIKLLVKLGKGILNKKDGSYILSGAYGSGKSYFLSVLLNLLSVQNNDEVDIFLNRAEKKFPVKDICKKFNNEKYLVVFAKDKFQSYEKAILHGILSVIRKENLNINLNLESEIILSKIKTWKEDYKNIISRLEESLLKRELNLDELVKGLEKNKTTSIKNFKEIYQDIFYGENFINYESNFQILDLIKDFEKKILETTSYRGIIYVFDEFGRYLESNINKIDVKEIQDMAEYCNSDNKSFLFLVTHKDIFQYTNKLNRKDNIHEWEKVTGRFHKEQMTYDKVTSLSVLSQVIYKKDNFETYYNENIEKFNNYKENLRATKLLPLDEDKILKDFYPLNYLSAYILPELSQKIAQNERTMFAFISSNDAKALESILSDEFLVGLDKIYDYFEENFKFLNHESLEYKSFFNTKKALTEVSKNEEIKFLKTLGIIQIYNRVSNVSPTKEILKLALDINENALNQILENLKSKNIVVYKRNNGHYKIVEDSDINIQKEIKDYIIKNLNKIDVTEALNKYCPLDAYYPVKYNYEMDITRFFNQIYLDSSNVDFLDKIKEVNDGTIVYLSNILNNLDYDYIKSNLKNRDIILVSNKENKRLKLEIILKELKSIDCLVALEKNINNKSVLEEYSIYRDELIDILKTELSDYFSLMNIEIAYLGKKVVETKMIDVTYEYLNKKFPKYIRINYELINKEKLSTPMKKVRFTLIEMILNNDKSLSKEEFYLETGAINSVARAVLNKIASVNKNKIVFEEEWLKLDKEILKKVKLENYSLEEIYLDYTTSKYGYGFRKGVFTLFLGLFLIKNKNNLLLIDNKTKQKQSLISDLVENIEKDSNNYYLAYIEKNKEEEEYLNDLKATLGIYFTESSEIESSIVEALKTYFYSLSRLINKVSFKNCKVLSKIFSMLFQEKNAHEFLFKELPLRAKTEKYKEIVSILSNEMNYLEEEKIKIENEIKSIIIDVLESGSEIKEGLEEWKSKNETLDNGIKTWLKKYNYKNERLFILDITSKIKGFNYENWSTLNDIEDFKTKLKGFLKVKEKSQLSMEDSVQVISNGERIIVEIMNEHTQMGKMLKTKLQSTIKAMGLSIKDEEKKSILLEILKEM
ncbi:MAG: hypothetical protein ACRC6E_12745 [Fusobacteriaceae bacterium]